MGATALRGPGLWNLDLSMAKTFKATETTHLQFKTDLLNALNHTQYMGVQPNLSGIAFGQVQAAAQARTIQMQLRLSF